VKARRSPRLGAEAERVFAVLLNFEQKDTKIFSLFHVVFRNGTKDLSSLPMTTMMLGARHDSVNDHEDDDG
jgi:hypothetical protein